MSQSYIVAILSKPRISTNVILQEEGKNPSIFFNYLMYILLLYITYITLANIPAMGKVDKKLVMNH